MFLFLTGLLQWFLLQQQEIHNNSNSSSSSSSSQHPTDSEQHHDIQQHIDTYSSATEATARALQQPEEEPRGVLDIVKAVILIVVCGAATIVALLAMTYFVSKLADLCDDRHRQGTTYSWPNGGGRVEDDIDRGSLTRKANLWGLRRSERLAILQEILKSTTKIYNSRNVDPNSNRNSVDQKNKMVAAIIDSGDHPGDIEMGAMTMPSTSLSASESEPWEAEEENRLDVATNVDGETTSSGAHHKPGRSTAATTERDTLARRTQHAPTRQQSTEDIADDAGARNYEKLCCICLSEYKDEESVLTGTQCVHMFHATCCQEWLIQNDLCPYCRKEIVRPSEFRATAVTLLGERRVQSFSLANVEPDLPAQTPFDSSTVSQANAVDPRSPSAARSPTEVFEAWI